MIGNKKPNIIKFKWVYLLSYLIILPIYGQENNGIKKFQKAIEIRYQNPDSSLILLKEAHKEFLIYKDTLNAINALIEMPFIGGQKVNYANSYDNLWRALFLSENIKDQELNAKIYTLLGRLYSFLKRKEEAFSHLNTSLKIKKRLLNENKISQEDLVPNYYAFCSTYRELNNTELGNKYLDSCFLYFNKKKQSINLAYLQFEKAHILSNENKNEEATHLFRKIEPWFYKNRPSYLVLVYTYWGDLHKQMEDFEESITLYKKALHISKIYNGHMDFTALIHERLSTIYYNRNDFKNSHLHINKAKEIDAIFFDSRSESNKSFIQIKDEYRIEKEKQERLIQKQRLAQLEQEDKISLLQRIILLGSLIFSIIIGFIYVKQLRVRHKAEKLVIRRNKELEIEKGKELLELKNKELAASALQLVEKDEFLRTLKNNLKENKDNTHNSEINKVIKSISISNDQSWEEFKLRFTAVNEKFYTKLNEQFPNLSQGDQKICALIKLNFSSKDMARLLGISVESVHTTRYRLRKKMGLPRSTNLEKFIANL